MKTLLTSILFLASLYNYAQSNRVYGEAFIKDVNILNDTLLRKNYSFTMYYAKDSIADTAKKKISKRSGYTFDFKISKFKLRKYQYIHFESFDHIIVLKISQILNNKQTIIFDSVNTHELSFFLDSIQNNDITTIQCMYAPEFTSHSEGVRVKIMK